MGILNNIFGNRGEAKQEKASNINWIPLTNLEQLEIIKEQSKTESILIFKHSTRCGISRMVIKQFEKMFDEDLKNLKVYYLDLLNYRSISDEVGYQFQVMHQSPQLLVVKEAVAVAHASHYDITQIDLTKF
ncbi:MULTISPECIES: bacillithiol system redox-active protein YtxJ [Tenacibaculum]|uniref:bacillithiol system redox-active protein YtxJ n=1 Tax=Tenacibaculum TaxID=104267 RepID=UPI001F0B3F1E|nr:MULTISPECIES: bacillithiol system redox-active protein YtxJ [Tenacibaculum]MCH3882063.1 bacillithiol system redox-active protein YtxJ [Tenacibaculum aquimarinum]MCH3885084.1 bacillithiol system redox-active protein YtxJ [Tenacibaculum aquimarinum]MDO6599704.1 bacillithiol system redox-active protein YtxJ [Tenacibaculum sp. 1_MG-2023]